MMLPSPAKGRDATIANDRPSLVLVAADMSRQAGTEPGKSWVWACALAQRYSLHVVTAPAVAERCRGEPEAADWTWHPTRVAQPLSTGLAYYRDYARWCRDVPRVVCALAPRIRPVGLHHITLGSFRVLPRYDRCGLNYIIGPVGGGETAPWGYVRSARLPWRALLGELARPCFNASAAVVPSLRAVMRRTRLALATTPETERVLRQMGAPRTGIAFPDSLRADVDPQVARPSIERAAMLRQRVRLVWVGRAVWWKAGQVAIELWRRLLFEGVDSELQIFSYGPALVAWTRQVAASGFPGRCCISGFIPRNELMRELGQAHVFVFPTLHDSANGSILEAYAMGLPSLTAGVGGPAMIATPATGYNERHATFETWMDGAIARVRRWREMPTEWQSASAAAQRRAADFGPAYIEGLVDRWLSREAFVT